MNTFEKARGFIYRNARPLDLARWQFHFEDGSREDVIKALAYYQNEDGGFGHGIEPDFLNPDSTPMATWAATEIIIETGWEDKSHPIIRGILQYLESGADFNTEHMQWLNTVPTNNDYPHAIWWENNGVGELRYNPTAALAGFILRYAEQGSAVHRLGCDIARQAVEWLLAQELFEEHHITACFIRLYDALKHTGMQLVDMSAFESRLRVLVTRCICQDREKWDIEYVTLPSDMFLCRDSIFYADNADIAEYELEHIRSKQQPDGSYNVPWQWWTDYKEFEVSANFWRSIITLKNMRYLKGLGVL